MDRKACKLCFAMLIAVIAQMGILTGTWAGTEGTYNTFYGVNAGHNLSGDNNVYATFVGRDAGAANTTGIDNTFVGYRAGVSNTTAYYNTFLGTNAGTNTTTGWGNTIVGANAGYSNATGYYNDFVGLQAGFFNTTGWSNAFIGFSAGYSNTTGNQNTFLGYSAGYSNNGSGNVFIGNGTGSNETIANNRLFIDNSSTTTPLIYGEFDNEILRVNGEFQVVNTNNGIIRLSSSTADTTTKAARMVVRHYNNAEEPVYLFGAASTSTDNFVALGGGSTIGNAATQVDIYTGANNTTQAGTARLTIKSTGYIGMGTQSPAYPLHMASGARVTTGGTWTNASSREYKENIQGLSADAALKALKDLEPVTFAYKTAPKEHHVGFIAEDVPDLVATEDRKGLSAMDIVAVLTKVVKEQQDALKQQETTIAVLTDKITRLERKTSAILTVADAE